MLKYALIPLVFLFTACMGPGTDTNVPDPQNITKNLFYFQDPRTELCFAALVSQIGATGTYVDAYSASITNVPCTDSVKYNLQDMQTFIPRSF